MSEEKENDCAFWLSLGEEPKCVIGCESCKDCDAYVSKDDVIIEVRHGKKLLATSEEK